MNRSPSTNVLPTFVIADTHFGHAAIRRYCDRPDNCDQMMIDNWNRTVRWKDEVLFLGDLSFAGEYETERILKKLGGRVSAVRGDHDKPAMLDLMRKRGWRIVDTFGRDYQGYVVTFTHQPSPSPLPPRTINVHGHVHCHEYDAGPCHINVSVEAIGYRPQRLTTLLDRVVSSG
jgi:calcineurin-like phosphoesterase family protein